MTMPRHLPRTTPDGGKWQPPARLVRPTEPDVVHPHHLAMKWKLISGALAVLLFVAIVIAGVGMLGGDDPVEGPTNTVVGGSVPIETVGGG